MPPVTSATRVDRLLACLRRPLLTCFLSWPPGHVLAALALGTALGACFNPPAQAVMFSCTPDDAVCPGGYTCEADGCCHRDGSDVEANFGACGLGTGASASDPSTGTAGTTDAPTTTSATTGEPDPSTSSDPGTSSSTSTGTTGTSTSTGTDTGADTGSSSAGTTGSAVPANL